MAEIISFNQHLVKKQCSSSPLQMLFQKHAVVLVGDELGAFYLDEAVAGQTEHAQKIQNDNNPFYPWDKRSRYEANVAYMEFVYAAHELGIQDIVIDMAPTMQAGIDEALTIYGNTSILKTPEVLFRSLLMNGYATPMDAVVQMAGALGIKVHALNGGLSGVATLFRKATGIDKVDLNASIEEKREQYAQKGLKADIEVLAHILRRQPTEIEIETMHQQMEMRLGKKRSDIEEAVFDESSTARLIQSEINGRPFLGFFQNERLFESATDLDALLRQTYGDAKVARLSMGNVENAEKQPQYRFRYSLRKCTVAMTESYARDQQVVKRRQ